MTFKPNSKPSLLCAILSVTWVPQLNAAPDQKLVVAKGGPVIEGFQLLAQTGSNIFSPSTPVLLSLSLKNTTDKILGTFSSNTYNDYQLDVMDIKGKPVPLTPYAQRRNKHGKVYFGTGLMEVAPGGEMREIFNVSRFFDMTKNDDYLIKAKRFVTKLNKPGYTTIESNVVRVKVDSSFKPAPPAPAQPSEQPKVE